jgi:hypothetical protein
MGGVAPPRFGNKPAGGEYKEKVVHGYEEMHALSFVINRHLSHKVSIAVTTTSLVQLQGRNL